MSRTINFRFFSPFLFFTDDRFMGDPLLKETRLGFKFGRGTALKPEDFAHILPTVTSQAVERIAALAADGRPFFIYYAPCAPHDPYAPKCLPRTAQQLLRFPLSDLPERIVV